jgi:hypothetical protein
MKSIAVVLISLGIVLPATAAEPAFARTCVKATQTGRGRMTASNGTEAIKLTPTQLIASVALDQVGKPFIEI